MESSGAIESSYPIWSFSLPQFGLGSLDWEGVTFSASFQLLSNHHSKDQV